VRRRCPGGTRGQVSWCPSSVAYEVPVGLREHPRQRSPKGEAKRGALQRATRRPTLHDGSLRKRDQGFHPCQMLSEMGAGVVRDDLSRRPWVVSTRTGEEMVKGFAQVLVG
jgi:hypothetical protein